QVELLQLLVQVGVPAPPPILLIEYGLLALVLIMMSACCLSTAAKSMTACEVNVLSPWMVLTPLVVAGGLLELGSSRPLTVFCWLLLRALSAWVSSIGRAGLVVIP